jgi:hypothetical protein
MSVRPVRTAGAITFHRENQADQGSQHRQACRQQDTQPANENPATWAQRPTALARFPAARSDPSARIVQVDTTIRDHPW